MRRDGGMTSLRVFKSSRPRSYPLPVQLLASPLSSASPASRRTWPGQRDAANQERPSGDVSSRQGRGGRGARGAPPGGEGEAAPEPALGARGGAHLLVGKGARARASGE